MRSPQVDSRSTWQLEGSPLRLRLPWSMLALGDPSSHVGVRPVDGRPVAVPLPQIELVVDAGPGGSATGTVRWDAWSTAAHQERLKPGIQPLVDTWAELSWPGPRLR